MEDIRGLKSHLHSGRPDGPEEGAKDPFLMPGRLSEHGAALLRIVGLGNVFEAEDGETLLGRPEGRVKGFVPDTRRGGLQRGSQYRVVKGGNREVQAAREDVGQGEGYVGKGRGGRWG